MASANGAPIKAAVANNTLAMMGITAQAIR